jgi:NTP pyrophosphatase (non-canonical NTP hydrolase)
VDFKEFIQKAKEIQKLYRELNKRRNEKNWTASEYVQGLVGDVGNLTRLVMAKNNFRTIKNVDEELRHEIVDCLWALIIISEELHLDLEKEYFEKMKKFEKIIKAA